MKNRFSEMVCFVVVIAISCQEESVIRKKPFCLIYINQLPEQHPMFINASTHKPIQPNRQPLDIYIEGDEEIEFHCFDSELLIKGRHRQNTVKGRCIWGRYFKINKAVLAVSDLMCGLEAPSTALVTKYRCTKHGLLIAVGFFLLDGTYEHLYNICYDSYLKLVYYVHYIVNQWAYWANYTVDEEWKGFHQEVVYIHHRFFYNWRYQQTTANTILNLDKEDTRYINEEMFLVKGAMASSTDFPYRREYIATMWYINCAPRWNTLHNNNWRLVETIIRKYASEMRVSLTIYSGTHGTLRLKNFWGKRRQIFLFIAMHPKFVPVPLLFWKLAYDEANKKGIVFFALNNPYFGGNFSDIIVCNDVSDQLGPNWPSRKNYSDNRLYGYIYACEISEVRKIFKFIPDFEVKSLLPVL